MIRLSPPYRGADSDVVLDIISRLDADHCVKYVWFDTGLEYAATKRHLDYLESRYGVKIERIRPKKSVPLCCREYGQPFISKYMSEAIHSMQANGFDWVDAPYEEMVGKFGKTYAGWWHNMYGDGKHGNSIFNICRKKYLKEFMIDNPPTFKIDRKCCDWTKKRLSKHVHKMYNSRLDITGVRKSESGIRSVNYKSCYSPSEHGIDKYRPLFWYNDKDKQEYKELFDIRYSDCYEMWGFTRTGCVGCPFNRDLWYDLEIVKRYEPNLYKACNVVFKDSYEYTRKFEEYARDMREREKYKRIIQTESE